MALHHALNNIGAGLSTVGHASDAAGPKGYPPAVLTAGTYTDGDPFSLEGARSLVLTHTWYQHDLDEVVAAARAVYGGDVAAATAGETIRG